MNEHEMLPNVVLMQSEVFFLAAHALEQGDFDRANEWAELVLRANDPEPMEIGGDDARGPLPDRGTP